MPVLLRPRYQLPAPVYQSVSYPFCLIPHPSIYPLFFVRKGSERIGYLLSCFTHTFSKGINLGNAPFFFVGLVLCQDLVQVKMSFSHSNLPAIPKLPVDTIFQNHRVTYNRNDYEFVWYYKTFPSIQIPGGMHVCNC